MSEPPDDARSPWERDDWMPEHDGPAEIPPRSGLDEKPIGERRVDGLRSRPDDAEALPLERRPNRSRRAIVGAVAVGALVAAGVTIVAVGDSAPRGDTASPSADGGAELTASPRTVPVGTVPVGTVPNGTLTPVPPPSDTSQVDSGQGGSAPGDSVRPGSDPSGPTIVSSIPDIATVDPLQPPAWTEWAIPVPELLAQLETPTEVIAITSGGVVHRIEFPSGRVRSVAVDGLGSEAQLAITADAIALTRSSEVLLLGDGRPLAEIEVSADGLGVIVSRADGFVVTGRTVSASEIEPIWVLGADGNLADITGGAFSDVETWERRFLPGGEMLVSRAGGVYAVALDGSARQISDGALVAAGAAHLAVERCDDVLQCETSIIDLATGEERVASLQALENYRFLDLSTRISPDGRSIHFVDWRRDSGVWQMLDVESGRGIDLEEAIGPPPYADPWFSDGSGVVTVNGALLTFTAVDGRTASISGLGNLGAVATRPLAPAS